MSPTQRILADHQYVVNSLSEEENKIALECARKVRIHLEKAFIREQHPRFLENIELVDQIISRHQLHLNHFQG